MDATVVPVTLHRPTDSTLLLDAVRVLDRLLQLGAESAAGFTAYHRHLKRAKRRAMEILHVAPQAIMRRRTCYRELVQLTGPQRATRRELGPSRVSAPHARPGTTPDAAHHAVATRRAE